MLSIFTNSNSGTVTASIPASHWIVHVEEIDVEKESAHEDDDKNQSDDENEVWEVTGALAVLGSFEGLLRLKQLLL